MEKNPWLSLEDAAEYLGVSTKTLRRWCHANAITHYRIGTGKKSPGMIRFQAGDLEAFLVETRVERKENAS